MFNWMKRQLCARPETLVEAALRAVIAAAVANALLYAGSEALGGNGITDWALVRLLVVLACFDYYRRYRAANAVRRRN